MTSDHGNPGFGAGGRFGPSASEEPEPVVVRDRRRVNPFGASAGAPGKPAAESAVPPVDLDPSDSPESPEQAEVIALSTQLAERTADLQRLKAEYDNYRRRVDRDRQVGSEQATAKALAGLLPTLDDIDRAEGHGDLVGPFQGVASSLRSAVLNLGLEQFGQPGDEFDPQVHEALVHTFQPGLGGPTCIEIYRSGYRFAGRVLRPAQVVVAEPPAPEESADGAT